MLKEASIIVEKILNKIVFVLFSVLIAVTFTQVFLRYIFSQGFTWAEELERYIFIWLMFIGMSVGIYRKKHFVLTAVADHFKRYTKVFNAFSTLCVCAFFIFLAFVGLKFALGGFSVSSNVLPVKLGYVYLILPVAGILSALFCLTLLFDKGGKA